MTNIDQRLGALEQLTAISEVKARFVRTIDHIVNGSAELDAVRAFVADKYTWKSEPFEEVHGSASFVDLVSRYAGRVTFSLQFLSGAMIDLSQEGGRASGQWTVWQPFTFENEAWVLGGRSYDSFLHSGDAWKLTDTHLKVEILTPWRESWGSSLISRRWLWRDGCASSKEETARS